MMFASRHATLAVAALAAICAVDASAQDRYPYRPIRIIQGFSAGGVSDTLARIVGASSWAAEFITRHPLLLDEPVPENGKLKVSALDGLGFGVRLNPESRLHRPYDH